MPVVRERSPGWLSASAGALAGLHRQGEAGNPRAHLAYESKVGPYHGTPSAWHVRATLSRTTSLLTTNTASNRCAIPATHASTSGRPREVSMRVTDPPASTRSTRSGPMAARWPRPIHKHSSCMGGRPSRYGSTGPMPAPVATMSTRR